MNYRHIKIVESSIIIIHSNRVNNCDRMIALTFHNDCDHLENMKTGGTQNIWKKKAKKHFKISN
jgi:hypothetical protein